MNLTSFCARVFEAAAQAGIAPAEIAYTQSESFSVRVRKGALEDYQVSDRVNLTLRGRVGSRIGASSTQALDEESVAMLVRGVAESAQLIETDEQDDILPPDEGYGTVCNYAAAVNAVSAQDKIALALRIDALMQDKDARITPDDTVVSSADEVFCLKNTLGLDLTHHSNMIYAYTGALAKEGERTATGFEIRWGYGMDALDPEAMADACCKDALGKLSANRLKSGAYPVVIKNTAMADLLSTFSGVFSADNAQKGLSLLAGREGEAIASPALTLTDDPLMPWGLASCPFDREGAATRRKDIIKAGVLATLLHNRKTARIANMQTTGNAAGSGRVSPTNLYIAPGTLSLEEMLLNLGDGLYLTEISGLHAGANPVSGDFSLLSRGYRVEGGRIGQAVEQFTIAGNFYQLLKDILSVGSDLYFEASPTGSPCVRVKNLNIAGED